MLKNDPPSGTSVRLLRTGEKATLLGSVSIRKDALDHPGDFFQVTLLAGEVLTVRRSEIEEAAARKSRAT